ncbi:MAG TPA: hypothetical protein VGU20_31050 [Stellaceae bacterium]|nr:hypothetical protein [Terriglobia bacterium]HEV2551789.1 hypothetical protein [Stellaceae bacterium]
MTAAAPIVTQTKLSICSAALVLCGEKPMNSLTDNRYGAAVCAALFDMVYETELQSNRWRFACKKAQLSQINVTPPNEFQFAFQLPTDMLLPIGFWGMGPDRSYEMYGGNIIYTNVKSNPGPVNASAPVLTFDYMYKPDVSTVPSYFSLLVTYALARDCIKPITESDTASTAMKMKYEVQRSRAMFIDAQGRPNRQLQHNPFVQVR